jgi:hypothetical protein
MCPGHRKRRASVLSSRKSASRRQDFGGGVEERTPTVKES